MAVWWVKGLGLLLEQRMNNWEIKSRVSFFFVQGMCSTRILGGVCLFVCFEHAYGKKLWFFKTRKPPLCEFSCIEWQYWCSLPLWLAWEWVLPSCGFSWASAFPSSGYPFDWGAIAVGTSSWHWPLPLSPLNLRKKSRKQCLGKGDWVLTPPSYFLCTCTVHCIVQNEMMGSWDPLGRNYIF